MSRKTGAIRVFFPGIQIMLFLISNMAGLAKSTDEIEAGAIEFETHTFTNQFLDPMQENRHGFGKVAFGPVAECYIINYKYNGLPRYRKSGTRGYQSFDYSNGNLMYWREIRNAGYSSGEFSRTLSTFEGLLISPQGTLIHETTSTIITIEPGNERTSHLDQIWHCLGIVSGDKGFRPIANSYAKNKSVFKASQAYKKNIYAYWKCTVDPNFELVRKAELVPVRSSHATSLVTTTGTVTRNGFTVAAEGQIQSLVADKSGAYLKVKTVRLAPQDDFLATIRSEITRTTGPKVSVSIAP